MRSKSKHFIVNVCKPNYSPELYQLQDQQLPVHLLLIKANLSLQRIKETYFAHY